MAIDDSEVKRGPLPLPLPDEGALIQVELEGLEDNPFQPRTEIDEEELEGLCASIARSGLLQPVALRPRPSGTYQIVAGHRRVAAFRRLRERASSEGERRRWARIPGVLLPELTDTQMAVSAFVENGQRQALTPLEEAEGLVRIQALLSEGFGREASAREVAAAVGYDEKRVRRLFQLHHAPQVVRDGVLGRLAPPEAEPSPRRETGRLNLMAALEFIRLHRHYAGANPAVADERVRKAIVRSLREGWGLRRVQAYVDGVLDGRPGARARPSLFRRNEQEFVVRTARILSASPVALRALHGSLSELLRLVEGHLAQLSGEPPPRNK